MIWTKIFASSEAMIQQLQENKPRLLIVNGKRICLVYREEKLRAIQDVCPHNGESLSKGAVNHIGEIICPWHGQQFSLKTGRECAERSPDAEIFLTKETGEGIFIGL